MQESGTLQATGGTRESRPMRFDTTLCQPHRATFDENDRWKNDKGQRVGEVTWVAKSWSKSSGPLTSAFMEAILANMLALALLSSRSVSAVGCGASGGSPP